MGKKIVIVNGEVVVDHTKTNVQPAAVLKDNIFYDQAGDLATGILEKEIIEVTPDFCNNIDEVYPSSNNKLIQKIIIHKPESLIDRPTAELTISENGVYDVTGYAKVIVSIE